mmetsp:Transcript_101603/g.286521  ORF Transcript_101603/g.286521 Transcript_101603/m.286521 type:complete len:207 (+) Transcript_101603:321-941(+)
MRRLTPFERSRGTSTNCPSVSQQPSSQRSFARRTNLGSPSWRSGRSNGVSSSLRTATTRGMGIAALSRRCPAAETAATSRTHCAVWISFVRWSLEHRALAPRAGGARRCWRCSKLPKSSQTQRFSTSRRPLSESFWRARLCTPIQAVCGAPAYGGRRRARSTKPLRGCRPRASTPQRHWSAPWAEAHSWRCRCQHRNPITWSGCDA